MENEKKKMTTDVKIFIGISVVIALIIVGAIITLVKPKNVATVGDNNVTSVEFQYYLSHNIQGILPYKDPNMDTQTFLSSPLAEGTVMDMVRQQALSQATEIEVLLQEAKKEGFTIDTQELNDTWEMMETNLIQNAEMSGISVKEFCKDAFGANLNQVKNIYRDQFTAEKYREKKVDEISVDETELSEFYEENQQYFNYNGVKHILIKCARDAEEAVTDEKSQLAQDILDRVDSGEDFSILVREFSEDPGSIESGGLYNIQQNGQMVPEFEDWTFSHEVGDTGIVRTDHGFHIMMLETIHDSLESQRENIEQVYKSDKYQTVLRGILDSDAYKIELEKGFYQ